MPDAVHPATVNILGAWEVTMAALSDEEKAIVEVVAEFVDREVRPAARELEHANTAGWPPANCERRWP
jgi:hypothetical protein